MKERFEGVLHVNDSKTVQVKYFQVPDFAEEVAIRFDYVPKSSAGSDNHLNLLVYDSMGRFMGRYDRNTNELVISENPSDCARKCLPLPGRWTAAIEVHGIFGKVSYVLEIETRGKRYCTWKCGELHSHSTHSDGIFRVKELGEYFKSLKLNYFFLTDHSNITGWRELEEVKEIKGFPGQELNTFHGHALILGCREFVDWKGRNLEERRISKVHEIVRNQGGLMGVAHPFIPGDPICVGCEWKHSVNPFSLDFVEVWSHLPGKARILNHLTIHRWIQCLRSGRKIPATAGSDFHRPSERDREAVRTWVRVRKLELEEVLYAIKTGQVYLSNGPKIHVLIDEKEAIGKTFVPSRNTVLSIRIEELEGKHKTFLISHNEVLEVETSVEQEIKVPHLEKRDFVILWMKNRKDETVILTNPIFFSEEAGNDEESGLRDIPHTLG